MDRPYVRLFLPDAVNPYHQLQAENASAVADRLALTLDVDFADGDFSVQVRQIVKATRQDVERPDVVMVMPVQETALRGLSEETVRRGIGWVFLNRTAGNVATLRQLATRPELAVGFVAPDQKGIGDAHARAVRLLFPQGAHVVYVQGRMTSSSAQERLAGFREAAARPGPALDVAGMIDGNWAAEDCEKALLRWLQLVIPTKVQVDAVVCQSDFMAMGALAALRKAADTFHMPGLRTLPVVGCDGMASVGKRMVDQGELAATVVVSTSAAPAIEAAAAACRGTAAMPEEVLLPPRLYPEEAVLLRQSRHTA